MVMIYAGLFYWIDWLNWSMGIFQYTGQMNRKKKKLIRIIKWSMLGRLLIKVLNWVIIQPVPVVFFQFLIWVVSFVVQLFF
jgi:hypothetical protein